MSPEQYRHRFACLTFTVMDYDWLSTNDFAGEAVAPLSDFCWPGRPNASPAGKSVQPAILHLSRSKPSGRCSFRLYHIFCLFYTNMLLAPRGDPRLYVQLPLRYRMKEPFNLEIFVSGVGAPLICFPPSSREARHGDAGRSRRRQRGSGVCPQAEGDREVDGGGLKAASAAACFGVF